jgi:CxxC motif-containing protein (DUF1111 family)
MTKKQNPLIVAMRLGIPISIFTAALVFVPNQGIAQGGPPPVGGPLPGLTPAEAQRFNDGRNEFVQNENPQSGLGPVFNGVSCVQCHGAGGAGGASPNLGVSVVTRIGANVNGEYTDLEEVGGALIQARSLREIIPNYPVPREVVPPEAAFVARRVTTPVFGNGLMEAIPESQILARQDPGDFNRDGVSGRANMIFNPEANRLEVGRFGWKCQVPSVHLFAGDAYLNEMGITSPSFPAEVRPQGQNLPPGADMVADPEDIGGVAVNRLTDFMRFVAPAPPLANQSPTGRAAFLSIGCGACHTPSMTTGVDPVAALSNRTVSLYSDLLLHDMGPGLADGIRQGQASGSEFRTAPLWGIRFRPVLLHDGRASTIDEAIRLHGGEASNTIGRYRTLNRTAQQAIIDFVRSL